VEPRTTTPLEAVDYARRRPGKLQPRRQEHKSRERVSRVVRESSAPIPPGGDHARIRGFPYFPADGGICGAISGSIPGECDEHESMCGCWMCRPL
jgi:hypothetical protein